MKKLAVVPFLFASFAFSPILKAQTVVPVILESAGPTTVSPKTLGDQVILEHKYNLKNLSPQPILAYALVALNSRGNVSSYNRVSSYPPMPPAVEANATKSFKQYFPKDPGRTEEDLNIDCVIFGDGSVYGPDRRNLRDVYSSIIFTRQQIWQSILNLLESKGLEETKSVLKRNLSNPGPVDVMVKLPPGVNSPPPSKK